MSESKSVRAVDVLPALGVIASLIFVGLEIRQNTAAVRGATYQAISDASIGGLEWGASDPDIRRVMGMMISDAAPSDFSSDDVVIATGVLYGILRRIENVYLQVREGLISEEAYVHFRPGGAGFFETRYFASFWEVHRSNFPEEYVLFFESEYLQ